MNILYHFFVIVLVLTYIHNIFVCVSEAYVATAGEASHIH